MFGNRRRHVIPGFGLTLGGTVLFVSLIILLPLCGLFWKTAEVGWTQFWHIVGSERALYSYRLTAGAACVAALFNAGFGLLMAWILVRYEFPGRKLLDAAMDLSFALPTAVAGIALASLYGSNGWLGHGLETIGIHVAYTPIGVSLAMAFTSVPFVVRTVQPVLEDLGQEIEEAAASLGAGRGQIFRRVIFPQIQPALLTGAILAFVRSLGEFGAIIFIAGNRPYETEITSLLIFIRLEEFDYPAAASLATVVLVSAFVLLILVQIWQVWNYRYQGKN